jgi:hypothetical protein
VKSHWNLALFSIAALLVGAPALAQSCVVVKKDERATNLPADADELRIISGTASASVPDSKPINGTATLTDAGTNSITNFLTGLSASDRAKAVLRPAKNGAIIAGAAPISIAEPPATCSATVATVAAAGSNAPPGTSPPATPPAASIIDPATAEDCFRESGWSLGSGRYRQPVLFNSKGAFCYAPPVIQQGDMLAMGMVLMPGEHMPEAHVDLGNCSPEDPTPRIFSSGEIPKGAFQSDSTQPKLVFLAASPCGTQAPVINLKIGTGQTAVTSPHTLSQFPRYQATFHLGALYSKLHKTEFALRDAGGTQVIQRKSAEKRGPEYVATVVVQGFLRYFGVKDSVTRTQAPHESAVVNFSGVNDPDNWPYKGRDPVHDGKFADNLGFVLSTGLDKPSERFGAGLSYEIARGLNIVAIYEVVKISQLDGYKVGDLFTGAADTIPTRKEWESKASLGLTFDIAYVTRLFGSGK